jgi:hypothetical protein
MALSTATPALANKADRAREAIAAAQAKVNTADSLGATAGLPHEAADAKAELNTARESLADGHTRDAVNEAIRASAMADTAIGVMQRRHQEAAAATQAQSAEAVSAAQQQAAEANARADAAEQSAANSAAEAANARNEAAAAAAQNPAEVETNVTTSSPSHQVTHHVIRRTTRRSVVTAPAQTTTSTTIHQQVN